MRQHLTGILDELCNRVDMLYAFAVIEFVLLVVSVAGLIVLEPGSAEYTIWVLNLVGLLVLFSFSAGVSVLCFRR